uniref:Ladderlectin-like isoform X2 n=1 Tax=Crassostrea virginica TaxID=6565 RepID=A0A8B8EW09_CRAVI|nr:ladderlectin-like isoform X2 [Crassostrea virginica]
MSLGILIHVAVFASFGFITTHAGALVNSTAKPVLTYEKCPDGFVRFQDSCYNFYVEQFSWPEAMVFCQALKYSLVTLTSPAQYEFLRSHLATITGAYPAAGFWTAGTAAELLGDWKWITTGQTIDFEQFNATDPNTGGHIGVSADQKSGCLALSKSMSFKISRQPCKTTQHFICERHDSS